MVCCNKRDNFTKIEYNPTATYAFDWFPRNYFPVGPLRFYFKIDYGFAINAGVNVGILT